MFFAQGKLEGSRDEEIGQPDDLDGDLNSGFRRMPRICDQLSPLPVSQLSSRLSEIGDSC